MKIPPKVLKFIMGAILLICSSVYSLVPLYASDVILEPISVQAKAHVYFLKFNSTVSWVEGIIDSDGDVVSASAVGNNRYVTSDFISAVGYQTFALVYSGSSFTQSPFMAEYDSDHNFLALHEVNSFSFNPIFSTCAYVRFCRLANVNVSLSQLSNYFSVFRHPDKLSITSSSSILYFWDTFSDVTISDPFIVLPYQIYGYNMYRVRFIFFEDAHLTNHISASFDVERNDPGESDWVSGLDGTTLAVIQPFYFDSFGQLNYNLPNSEFYDGIHLSIDDVLGTLSVDDAFFSPGYFSGFDLVFNFSGTVSNNFRINLTWLEFDDSVYSVSIDASDAIDDLADLGDSLIMPSPDTSAIFNNINVSVQQMNNQDFNSVDWFGPSGGILMSMLVTTFCFAALGYILFGKRG